MSIATQRPPHLLIRASAGSGKTFQLSNRFLEVLDDASPDHILATTFTRKAAGEILDRVLTRLAEAATDPDALRDMAKHLQRPELQFGDCLAWLSRVLEMLHRLRVCTLDSFFAQIATTFSLELGLPPGWRMIDDVADQALRTRAIANLLNGEQKDVIALLHLLTKGTATRSVSEQIDALVTSLHAVYLDTDSEAWRQLPQPDRLTAAQLEELLEQIRVAPLPSHKSVHAGRARDLDHALEENWVELLAGGIAAKVLAGEEKYYGKPIEEPVAGLYRRLIEHARGVLLTQLAHQTEATHELLRRFDVEYARLKSGARALSFDDITRRLGNVAWRDRLDDLAFRLDSQIEHLLLDEFQDTSLAQWNVVRPFSRRVVQEDACGRSFFCVGDVKQAIYGWRGGVAEIFDALSDELTGLQSLPLARSYRSSPVIIDAVNAVFENLSSNDALRQSPAGASAWAGGFEVHSTARTSLPGYARMIVAPHGSDGKPDQGVTLSFAANEIARLSGESPDRSVGVLVRDNKAVARLIYELRRRGVAASEEGGNPLTDSAAVLTVLSALTLADHPGDRAASYHVATSPLGPVLGLSERPNMAEVANASQMIRRLLLDDGYGVTLYRWARALAPSCDAREMNRLLQLVEFAYRYDPEATLRVGDFVKRVAAERIADPTTARIRVMTVHQAKGLQFDIVVLPQLDKPLLGQTPTVIIGRDKATEAPNCVIRYAGKEVQALLDRKFRQMFDARQAQAVREALCLLYVAITRPVHALHMIVAPSTANEGQIPSTFAGVLRCALTTQGRLIPGAVAYEHGDVDWDVTSDDEKTAAGDNASPAVPGEAAIGAEARQPGSHAAINKDVVQKLPLAQSPQRLDRGLQRQSPHALAGNDRVDLKHWLRLDDTGAWRGTLLHLLFEQVTWLDDATPEDEALRRLALARLRRSLSDEDLTLFRAMLAQSAVRAALSRSEYALGSKGAQRSAAHASAKLKRPRWTLERERTFAVRDGNAVLTGQFDRLVLLYDGDACVGADILDFKSDLANGQSEISQRVDHYRPQLAAYRRAAQKLFGLTEGQVSARLVFLRSGQVITI